MKNVYKFSLFLVFLTLASCVSTPRVDFNDPLSIESGIIKTVDEYRGSAKIEGPVSASDNPIGKFMGSTIVLPGGNAKKLSARLNNKKISAIYIELQDTYQGEWRFYSSATDINQKNMSFRNVDRRVGSCSQGCNLTEEVRIAIDLDYLKENINDGINIQVYGQRGGAKIILSPTYVKTFYDYLIKETSSNL
jgi:hypothetical protein